MQKTDARTLREIERLFERYKIELRDSPLACNSKRNHETGTYYFLRWIQGTYTPGQGLR